MLKLVRLALTAAVLTALAVRLRRRAQLRGAAQVAPEPPPPAPGRTSRGMGLAWLGIAGVVGATLVVILIRPAASGTGTTLPVPPTGTGWVTHEPLPSKTPTRGVTATRTPGLVGDDPPATGCVPDADPVTVRPLDPDVRRSVDRQWRRIERALKGPGATVSGVLGRPGKARTIAIAESQMGLKFPDDLRASLLRHNGFTISGRRYLGIKEIRDAWRAGCADPLESLLIPVTGTMSLRETATSSYLSMLREAP